MALRSALTILPAPSLAERTSLRLGGRAVAELRVGNRAGCEELAEALQKVGGTPSMLGGGTNILAHDGELPLTLISVQAPEENAFAIVDKTDATAVIVRVAAGMHLPVLVHALAQRSLTGLSALAGVPGTVGGAIAGNAGAHGADMASVLRRITVFTPEKGFVTIPATACQFGYRKCVLPTLETAAWYVITEAELCLAQGERAEIQEAMNTAIARKKATQPLGQHSAGCVFKNPEGLAAAGKLLDSLGFKGKECGGMFFSPVHANFLINSGKGSATAALDLIQTARGAVQAAYGVSLELEIKVLS